MSAQLSAADAVAWTGGALERGSRERGFTGVSIDSRSVGAGELFVAIAGPRFDGHDFLAAAAAAGAGGLVVERGRARPAGLDPNLAVIAVDDTTRALGALAAGHRRRFSGPLVAVTGSNGKTTTKEMCAAALAAAGPCLKNEGNLNNQFGLPLTLLRRTCDVRAVVVELGMNHRGEIAVLAEIARPDVGVITNVGTAHIENLGSQEAIAREKGDLLAALPAEGTAVVNADDLRAAAQAERTRARVVRFGRGEDADVRAADVRCLDGRGYAFELVAAEGAVAVEVAGLGETTVANALAAAAAARAAGEPLDAIAAGLARYVPVRRRLERIELPGGVVVIDDTYNANPQSTEAALRLLARLGRGGRAVAVLGHMGELGDRAAAAHREIGRLAARLDVAWIFALGEDAEELVAGAVEAGLDAERARVVRDHDDAAARVEKILAPGVQVLVKGSRAMAMERVVERLVAGAEA